MLFNLLQADTAALAETVATQQEVRLSLIDMASKGGWLMIVLLILSIMAIYIFGSKWWMIRKAGNIDKNFMNDIHDLIHDGKIKSAIDLCQRYDSPIARLVEKESVGRCRISRLRLKTWVMWKLPDSRRDSLCLQPFPEVHL